MEKKIGLFKKKEQTPPPIEEPTPAPAPMPEAIEEGPKQPRKSSVIRLDGSNAPKPQPKPTPAPQPKPQPSAASGDSQKEKKSSVIKLTNGGTPAQKPQSGSSTKPVDNKQPQPKKVVEVPEPQPVIEEEPAPMPKKPATLSGSMLVAKPKPGMSLIQGTGEPGSSKPVSTSPSAFPQLGGNSTPRSASGFPQLGRGPQPAVEEEPAVPEPIEEKPTSVKPVDNVKPAAPAPKPTSVQPVGPKPAPQPAGGPKPTSVKPVGSVKPAAPAPKPTSVQPVGPKPAPQQPAGGPKPTSVKPVGSVKPAAPAPKPTSVQPVGPKPAPQQPAGGPKPTSIKPVSAIKTPSTQPPQAPTTPPQQPIETPTPTPQPEKKSDNKMMLIIIILLVVILIGGIIFIVTRPKDTDTPTPTPTPQPSATEPSETAPIQPDDPNNVNQSLTHGDIERFLGYVPSDMSFGDNSFYKQGVVSIDDLDKTYITSRAIIASEDCFKLGKNCPFDNSTTIEYTYGGRVRKTKEYIPLSYINKSLKDMYNVELQEDAMEDETVIPVNGVNYLYYKGNFIRHSLNEAKIGYVIHYIDTYDIKTEEITIYEYVAFYDVLDKLSTPIEGASTDEHGLYDFNNFYSTTMKNNNTEITKYVKENKEKFTKYKHIFKKGSLDYYWYSTERV